MKRGELISRLNAAGFKHVDSSRSVWTLSPVVTWRVVDSDDNVELDPVQSFTGSKARLAELALATGFDFMGEGDLLTPPPCAGDARPSSHAEHRADREGNREKERAAVKTRSRCGTLSPSGTNPD